MSGGPLLPRNSPAGLHSDVTRVGYVPPVPPRCPEVTPVTAAENLARWRQAEDAAVRGPWIAHDDGTVWPNGGVAEGDPAAASMWPENSDFIATSREAMPALLAFAEALVTLTGNLSTLKEPLIPVRMVQRLAERHLGGAR